MTDPNASKRLARRLTERRREMRMTQEILAGAAEVSRSTVQRAERGLPITDESLRAICAVLGTTWEDPAPARGAARWWMRPLPPPDPLWTTDIALAAALLVLAAACLHGRVWAVSAAPESWSGVPFFYGYLAWLATQTALSGVALAALGRAFLLRRADEVVLGSGRVAWRRGSVSFARGPLPFVRWRSAGAPVRTLAAGLMVVPLTLLSLIAAHHPVMSGKREMAFSLGYRQTARLAPAWSVDAGSPLHAAGVRTGDHLVAVDGTPVETYDDLLLLIGEPGRPMAMRFIRPGVTDPETGRTSPSGHVEVAVAPVLRTLRDGSELKWIGNLRGLVSPLETPKGVLDLAAATLSEIAFVGQMALAPSETRHALLQKEPGGLAKHVRWATFREASESAALTVFLSLLATLILVAVSEGLRRGLLRIRRRPPELAAA